jgi:hypothetical protein
MIGAVILVAYHQIFMELVLPVLLVWREWVDSGDNEDARIQVIHGFVFIFDGVLPNNLD